MDFVVPKDLNGSDPVRTEGVVGYVCEADGDDAALGVMAPGEVFDDADCSVDASSLAGEVEHADVGVVSVGWK